MYLLHEYYGFFSYSFVGSSSAQGNRSTILNYRSQNYRSESCTSQSYALENRHFVDNSKTTNSETSYQGLVFSGPVYLDGSKAYYIHGGSGGECRNQHIYAWISHAVKIVDSGWQAKFFEVEQSFYV